MYSLLVVDGAMPTESVTDKERKVLPKTEREVRVRPDWKDYLAFIRALFQTGLLPFILLILVFVFTGIIFLFLLR
jgi:hypothetical protein